MYEVESIYLLLKCVDHMFYGITRRDRYLLELKSGHFYHRRSDEDSKRK